MQPTNAWWSRAPLGLSQRSWLLPKGLAHDLRPYHVHVDSRCVESGRDLRWARRRGRARRREAARRLDRRLSGDHRPDECHRVRLSLRDLPAVARRRNPLARRLADRDRRALLEAPRWSLAPSVRGRSGARALPERLRLARATVPKGSGPDRRGTDPEGAAISGDTARRAGAVRLAGKGRATGVPRGV